MNNFTEQKNLINKKVLDELSTILLEKHLNNEDKGIPSITKEVLKAIMTMPLQESYRLSEIREHLNNNSVVCNSDKSVGDALVALQNLGFIDYRSKQRKGTTIKLLK